MWRPADRMRGQNIIRGFLFITFFSIGAAVLAGAILCDELVGYYNNRQLLAKAQDDLDKLKALNADYDILLEQLQDDPDLIERLAVASLGKETADANTVYPQATPQEMEAARQALKEDLKSQASEEVMPKWLSRCSEPRKRMALFLSGGFLILISLIFFGKGKQTLQAQ